MHFWHERRKITALKHDEEVSIVLMNKPKQFHASVGLYVFPLKKSMVIQINERELKRVDMLLI